MRSSASRETQRQQEIKVSVLGVKQLIPRENGNALRKAFCKLRLGSKKHRTQTIKQVLGLNSSVAHLDSKPEESFLFTVPVPASGEVPHLSVSVWDYNRFSWSVFLGEAYIALIPGVTHVEHWYPLDDWHDQPAGETSKYSAVGGLVKVRIEWCQDESEKRSHVRLTSLRIERVLDAFFELQERPEPQQPLFTTSAPPPPPLPSSSPRDIARPSSSKPSSSSPFGSWSPPIGTPPFPGFAPSGGALGSSPPMGSPIFFGAARESPQSSRRGSASPPGGGPAATSALAPTAATNVPRSSGSDLSGGGNSGGNSRASFGGSASTSNADALASWRAPQRDRSDGDYKDPLVIIDDYVDAEIIDRSDSGGEPRTSSGNFSAASQSAGVSPNLSRNSASPSPLPARHASPLQATDEPDASNPAVEDLSDFNARFQKITEKIRTFGNFDVDFDTKLKANLELLSLMQDFQHTVVQYGKIIISERYLPVAQKTIQPVQMGGIAGGDKYLVHSILFKFAVDSRGLYGGNDSLAAKVASNELRSIINWYNLPADIDICVPIACILDYKGFRLIAMSWLPIHKGTLIYGSEDAGNHVHAEDPKFNEMMKTGCTMLKLKEHLAGLDEKTSQYIYSCVDIEGHKGTDHRYYIVDMSRLFPPMTPSEDVHRSYLVRLFRPEFVMSYQKPLCADGFSRFVRNDPDRETHNEELREATNYLLGTVVPDFAKQLLSLYQDWKTKGETPDRFPLVTELHRSGINVRLIGRVAENLEYSKFPDDKPTLASINELRWLLIMEMIARVIKHNIRVGLQEKMKQLRVPLDEPYRRFIIDYLNRVFSSEPKSKQCWQDQLSRDVERKFEVDLNAVVPFRTEPARSSRSNSGLSDRSTVKSHPTLSNQRLLKSSSDLSDEQQQVSPPPEFPGLRSPTESMSPPPARSSRSFFSVLGWSSSRTPLKSSKSPSGSPVDSPSFPRFSPGGLSPAGTPEMPRSSGTSGSPKGLRTVSPVLSPREMPIALPPKGALASAAGAGLMSVSAPVTLQSSSDAVDGASPPRVSSDADALKHSASEADAHLRRERRAALAAQQAPLSAISADGATSKGHRRKTSVDERLGRAMDAAAEKVKGHHRRKSSEDGSRRLPRPWDLSSSPPRHDLIGVSLGHGHGLQPPPVTRGVPISGLPLPAGGMRTSSPIAMPRGSKSQPPSPRAGAPPSPREAASSPGGNGPAPSAGLRLARPDYPSVVETPSSPTADTEYATPIVPSRRTPPVSSPTGSRTPPSPTSFDATPPGDVGRKRSDSTPAPVLRAPSDSRRPLFGPTLAVSDAHPFDRDPHGAPSRSSSSSPDRTERRSQSDIGARPATESDSFTISALSETAVAPKFVPAIPRNQSHRKFTGTGSDFGAPLPAPPAERSSRSGITADRRRRSRTAPTMSFNFQSSILLGAERWLWQPPPSAGAALGSVDLRSSSFAGTPLGASSSSSVASHADPSAGGSPLWRSRGASALLSSSSSSLPPPPVPAPDVSTLSLWLTNYSPFEAKASVDSRVHIIRRVVKMTGMRISHRAIRYLEDGLPWRKMHYEDLHDVGERVKHMNIINHALGFIYKIRSWQYNGEERQHLLLKAQKCFEAALETDPNSAITLRNLAQLQTLMDDGPTLSYLSPRVEKANEYYLRAIDKHPTDKATLFQYASFLEQCGLLDSALEYLLRVAELGQVQEAFIGLLLKIVSKMDVSDLSESCREKLARLASDSRDFRRRRNTNR